MDRCETRSIVAPAAGLAGAGLAALAYAGLVERNLFRLREFEVPVLAPGAEPLRMLHLSDLHLTSAQRRKADWIRRLDRLDPDLVVVTGDFLAGMDAVGPVLAALEPLLARPGAFVPGNNDYYAPRFKNPLRYFVPEKEPGLRRRAALARAGGGAGRRRLGRPHQPPRHAQGRRPGGRAGRHRRPAPRPRPVRPGRRPADRTPTSGWA